jgi:hypothetical protein
MIVMTLSYTKKTGDQSLIKAYVRSRPTTPYHITERRLQTELLDQWAQFLVTDALIPANQISTDDFAGPLVRICIYSNDPEVDMYATFFQVNQTNLAIKGIIGIQAMSEIWSILGNDSMAKKYSAIAASYIPQWQAYATAASGDHLTLSVSTGP